VELFLGELGELYLEDSSSSWDRKTTEKVSLSAAIVQPKNF